MNPKQVIDLMVERGVADESQVEDIMQEVSNTGKSAVQVLVDSGFLSEEQFWHHVAEHLGPAAQRAARNGILDPVEQTHGGIHWRSDPRTAVRIGERVPREQ